MSTQPTPPADADRLNTSANRMAPMRLETEMSVNTRSSGLTPQRNGLGDQDDGVVILSKGMFYCFEADLFFWYVICAGVCLILNLVPSSSDGGRLVTMLSMSFVSCTIILHKVATSIIK